MKNLHPLQPWQFQYWFPGDPLPEEIPPGCEYRSWRDTGWARPELDLPTSWGSWIRRWRVPKLIPFGLLSEDEQNMLRQANEHGWLEEYCMKKWRGRFISPFYSCSTYRIRPDAPHEPPVEWVTPTQEDAVHYPQVEVRDSHAAAWCGPVTLIGINPKEPYAPFITVCATSMKPQLSRYARMKKQQ